ncbi:hypothetical protein NW764_016140 [Fusarium oxysporum]|nr:hypothetical protein NW764_016140 [Fusarium oxysporum]
MVEAGIFLGCSFILNYWYSPAEIHSRMTIFYCGASFAGAFTGLLAYGIGHLDCTWGFRGWRFIYCIEAGGETGIAEKEEFSWRAAKDAFTSFHIYAVALMEFTLCVTVYSY